MARAVHDQSEQSDRDDRIRDRLDSYFATMGMGFNAYLERRNRMEEMRRLSALPDDELQALASRAPTSPPMFSVICSISDHRATFTAPRRTLFGTGHSKPLRGFPPSPITPLAGP